LGGAKGDSCARGFCCEPPSLPLQATGAITVDLGVGRTVAEPVPHVTESFAPAEVAGGTEPRWRSHDKGVFVAAGFSGHGFMIAPAVARILAEVVLGGPSDPVLEILDVGRFAENRLVPEPQLV